MDGMDGWDGILLRSLVQLKHLAVLKKINVLNVLRVPDTEGIHLSSISELQKKTSFHRFYK